jgi:REG-2-like HAD superfamily hydrolase
MDLAIGDVGDEPKIIRHDSNRKQELPALDPETGQPIGNLQSIDFPAMPKLITFDVTNTVLELTTQVGMFYRESLFAATDHRARLPGPKVFTNAFKPVYAQQCIDSPCFGGTSKNPMTARTWWENVVRETYRAVPHIDYEPGLRDWMENDGLFEVVFEDLYENVFTGAEAWQIKQDVPDFLGWVRRWKEIPNGPKIGVLTNFDNRVEIILDNLGILDVFDFIVTSEECKMEKPERGIFDAAKAAAGVVDSRDCVHIGDKYDLDVVGAGKAGWHAIHIPQRWTNQDEKVTNGGFEYTLKNDLWQVLDVYRLDYGRRIITTTRAIMEDGNDGFMQHSWEDTEERNKYIMEESRIDSQKDAVWD